jgi:hypothetical protein
MTSLPPLDEQLVFELERWMLVAEGVQIFPCSRGSMFALPLDEHLTHPTGQSSMHSAFWLWLYCTIVNDRAEEVVQLVARPPTS